MSNKWLSVTGPNSDKIWKVCYILMAMGSILMTRCGGIFHFCGYGLIFQIFMARSLPRIGIFAPFKWLAA